MDPPVVDGLKRSACMNRAIALGFARSRQLLGLLGVVTRYGLYRLSFHYLYSNQMSAFSELLVISHRLRRLCGMTTITERAYLQWFAKCIFTNQGAIVDLGCWLGSTTIPLAIGVTQNPKITPPYREIFAYDVFEWRSWMEPAVVGTPLEGRYRDGDSFLDHFKESIEPWRGRIIVRVGDLPEIGWQGGSIEFLLVDAMKSWELANGIIGHFYPALMPGRSLVFHQDFAHWYTPWIHLTHYRLRHYFDVDYDVPRSTSVVFRLREPLPSDLRATRYGLDSFGVDEIHAAFEYSCSLVSVDKRANIAAAKVMCFVHSGDLTQARLELQSCRSRGFTFNSDLAIVEERLRDASETLSNAQK
jgi:hypothetical protein